MSDDNDHIEIDLGDPAKVEKAPAMIPMISILFIINLNTLA